MLKALRTLGEIVGTTLHDPVRADFVLVLDFNANGIYQRVSLESFQEKLVPLYLFRKAKGANPPTLTPTLFLNRDAVEKSVRNLRLAYQRLQEASPEVPPLSFKDVEARMKQDIADAIVNIPNKKAKILLTLRINGQFTGGIPAFQNALRLRLSAQGERSRNKASCAVCGKFGEISGDISPFKFYTVDKPGFVAGGLDKSVAYKCFPLCYECRDLIHAGKKHVENNLQFEFVSGMSYLLIPDFILGAEQLSKEVLDILTADRTQRTHRLSTSEAKRITADTQEILELLSHEQDVMAMHFLFMQPRKPRTSEEKIELYIQDVYPSRLATLFAAKDAIEKLFSIPGEFSYNFSYATIHQFFKGGQDQKEAFFILIDRTFKGGALGERALLNYLINHIRQEAVEQPPSVYTDIIRDAAASYLFVALTTGKEGKMGGRLSEAKTLDEVLEALPVLNTPEKKGIFLLGVLVEKLLHIQYRERGSTPFWKTLKGLRMTEQDARALLPKIRAKLEEYNEFKRTEHLLFEEICRWLGETKIPWDLSTDETNFYLALGMGLHNYVNKVIRSEEGGDGDSKPAA